MKDTMYVDGVSQIHFLGGMVRMDMFTLKPGEGQQPAQQEAGQIVMTPQGLVSCINAMQQLADRLVTAGVLQKNQ